MVVWVSFRESGGSHGQYESALHLLWGEVGRASAQAITIIPDSFSGRAVPGRPLRRGIASLS